MTTGSWTGGRRRRLTLPRPRLRWLISARGLAVIAAVLLIAAIGWLWFRGSSFVRIKRVAVVGLSGPDVRQIRQALTAAAESMTTLNLSVSKLDAAVAAYPAVRSLSVTTSYPHGVTIAVNEQVPIADVTMGGRFVLVDGAGELLPDSTVPHSILPTLPLRSAPQGERITATGALAALKVLQAAPYRFLAHVQSATYSAQHGVVVQLRNGPQLYFGPNSQLAAKWVAVTAVLGNSGSQGAQYIDVSDPRRPAAGAATPSSGTTSSTSSSTASANTKP
jgi:cell division protein FtsQ